jgi:putative transposase
MLAERHRRWHVDNQSTSYVQANDELTAFKQRDDMAFLSEVSSVPLQQCLRHQQKAMVAFFEKRSRYPRFKSRRNRQAAEYTRSAFRYDPTAQSLTLAKMDAPLNIIWSRSLPDGVEPTTVTVSRDWAGRWHVSMLCDTETELLPVTGNAIGVDLGLKSFAVTSDGEVIGHPKLLDRKATRLARYQRAIARKQKGSTNRAKARVKVARVHAEIADARRDFLHKTSTRLVRTNDVIVVEDLAPAHMVRNHCLARSISDSGWAEFRSQLEYKCGWYGRTLVVIDRFYPSSKTCSTCGHLLAELSLGTRHWVCPGCGTRHDRDLNAAKNILAAGLAVTACGADVRPGRGTVRRSALKQETQPVKVGIPHL